MTSSHQSGQPGTARRPVRGWLLTAVLWLGLLLCAAVLSRYASEFSTVLARLNGLTAVASAACILLGWIFAAAAWKQTVFVIAGVKLSYATALRQLGLLLVGKYIPGGVFGFLARLYDGDHMGARTRLAAAGLFEQMMGLAMLASTGALLYAAATCQAAWILCGLLAIPWLAVVACQLVLHGLGALSFRRLQAVLDALRHSPPGWIGLLRAALLTQLASLGWLAVVVLLAVRGFGLEPLHALGVAGAFSLAVTAGMLAVFAPGGIGVREAVMVVLSAPWLGGGEAIVLAAAMRMLSVALDMLAGAAAVLVSLFAKYSTARSS
jgi:hypothetical protein